MFVIPKLKDQMENAIRVFFKQFLRLLDKVLKESHILMHQTSSTALKECWKRIRNFCSIYLVIQLNLKNLHGNVMLSQVVNAIEMKLL